MIEKNKFIPPEYLKNDGAPGGTNSDKTSTKDSVKKKKKKLTIIATTHYFIQKKEDNQFF